MTPTTGSPIRRRRFIIFAVLLISFIYFFGGPWELPPAIKDTDFSSLSRANIVNLVKSKYKSSSTTAKVDEIYGLLHLVSGDAEHQHVLSQAVDLDPTQPISLTVYAAGDSSLKWEKEANDLNERHPIVVFSKSYCPYSRRAKELLQSYDIKPTPLIVEVDLRDDSNTIKAILTRLTKRGTFPNIIVRGRSIGGSDEIHELHSQRLLGKVLEESGAVERNDGSGK